jgi:hypothetical protein
LLFTACGYREQADIMFVMDSVNAGRKNTQKALDFAKGLVNHFDVNNEGIQVGLMSAECHETQDGFSLGSHGDKNTVMSALQDTPGTDFAKMLNEMRNGAFSPEQGGRKEAKKIAILLVDGNLEEPLKALSAAQRARIRGVEVFVIQVNGS